MHRYAVVDLGTNIFHFLAAVADAHQPNGWSALQRDRAVVQLAEEGIEYIGTAAFRRGQEAMQRFRRHADALGIPPTSICAIGTAALRTARNAPHFAQAVEQETGIRLQIVSGQREAELIFKGVRQAVPFAPPPYLVVDIGGGSVEFILAEADRVRWQQSFPIGTTVLYRRFHKSDPIAPAEVAALTDYLDDMLGELWEAMQEYPPKALVGAAGAFDTLDELINEPQHDEALYGHIHRSGFEQLYRRLLPSTLQERSSWPGLKPERRQTIVVGTVLIQHLLQRAPVDDIYASKYSLKEGVLAEWAAALH